MIIPSTSISLIVLAGITLMYAAVCDQRSFTIPITVWVPVILWGMIIWVAEFTLLGAIATIVTIAIVSIPALFGVYGGADAIAFSVVAFAAPFLIMGTIPVGIAVWFTSMAVWALHHHIKKRTRYPYIIYIAPAYISAIAIMVIPWQHIQ